jgi:hypothetical protein
MDHAGNHITYLSESVFPQKDPPHILEMATRRSRR